MSDDQVIPTQTWSEDGIDASLNELREAIRVSDDYKAGLRDGGAQLLDDFAMAAHMGILAGITRCPDASTSPADLARAAYDQAEAMMAERGKRREARTQ